MTERVKIPSQAVSSDARPGVRETFRARELGPYSSHPATQGVRSRSWWRWSVAPTVAIAAAILLAAAIFGAGILSSSWRILEWGFLASVFGLAMGCSAILSVRLGVASPPVAAREVSGPVVRWKPWACWAALIGLLSFIPYLIANAAGLSDPLQRGLSLAACMLPLLFVEAALSFSSRKPDRNPALAILGPAVTTAAGTAAVLTVLSSVSDGIRSAVASVREYAIGWTPRLGPLEGWARSVLEQVLSDRFAGFAGILVLLFACATVFSRFMLVAGWAEDAKPSKAGHSLLMRVLSFAWWFLTAPFRLAWRLVRGRTKPKEGEASSVVKNTDPEPDVSWIDGVRAAFRAKLGEGVDLIVRESTRRSVAATSRPDRKGKARLKSLDWLFSGFEPSEGQLLSFSRFQSNYREALIRIEELDSGNDPRPILDSPDLLVLSPPGGGRTTAFVAMAAYAAIARGQRVLVVTSSVQESRLVAGKINAVLEKGFVGHLIKAAAGCTSDDPWVATLDGVVKGERSEGEPGDPSPQILVASLQEFEQLLFGIGQATAAMRAYLMGLGVVIVDTVDPHAGDPIANLHLPFWLDKVRLLSEVNGYPLQVVVGMPDLDLGNTGPGEGATGFVMDRLLGRADAGDKALVRMAPIRDAAVTVVDVVTGGATEEKAIEGLVSALSEAGRDVILFKADIDDSARVNLERMVQRASTGRGRTAVVSTVSSLETSGFREATVVVLRDTTKGRSIVRIASRLETDAPIFFRLGCRAEDSDWKAGLKATLPVLAARSAEPLMVAHLRSVAPMVPRNVPIRFSRLEKFGVMRPGDYEERSRRQGTGDERALADWSLRCDIAVTDGWGNDSSVYVWDMAFIAGTRTIAAEPVAFAATDGSVTESVVLKPVGDGVLSPFLLDGKFDPRRLVQWTDRDFQPLGPPVDLSGCAQLTYLDRSDPKRGRLKPRLIETIEGGRRRIVGIPWRDESEDGFLPVLDVSFDIDSGHRFETGIVGLPPGIRMFVPHRSATPVEASFVIREFISPSGDRQDISPDLEWNQDVKVSLCLWGVPGGDAEGEALDDPAAAYLGPWRTSTVPITEGHLVSRAFWPLLTAAIQHALDTIVPDWAGYARIMAFHAPRGGDGAVLMVLEPLSTSGTIRDTLLAILEDRELRQVFRGGVESFLRSAEGHPLPPMAPAFRNGLGGNPIGSQEVVAALEIVRRAFEGVTAARGMVVRTGRIQCFDGDGTERSVIPGEVQLDDSSRFGTGDQRSFQNHQARPAVVGRDGLKRGADRGPRFSFSHGIGEEVAAKASAGFGADLDMLAGRRPIDPACIREQADRGIRFRADGVAEIDYGWMIEQSRPALEATVRAVEDLAKEAGLDSPRAKAALFAALVQSTAYVVSRESRVPAGFGHFGVQVPVATLLDGKGDCDSVAVLYVALLRVSGTCRAGVVLLGPTAKDLAEKGNQAPGHAMVAIEVPPHETDDVLVLRDGREECRLVLVELTGPHPLGGISRDYQGAVADLVAFR